LASFTFTTLFVRSLIMHITTELVVNTTLMCFAGVGIAYVGHGLLCGAARLIVTHPDAFLRWIGARPLPRPAPPIER
jgi:hypothetical protein